MSSSGLLLQAGVAITTGISLGLSSTFLPFELLRLRMINPPKMIQRYMIAKKGEEGKEEGTISNACPMLRSPQWLFSGVLLLALLSLQESQVTF